MKHLYKTLLIAFLIPGYIHSVLAQNASSWAKVSGPIVDGQGQPVAYASVSLLTARDSSVAEGTLSSETGSYLFDHVKPGTYIIKASEVGYANALSPAFTVKQDTATAHIPVLKMLVSSHSLNAVTIIASKPLVEHLADRTVMNVENSVLAAGNNALDILERAPGVTIDKDNNISLKGKQGVTVMINGKLTYLSPAQLATLLQSTDGTTIKSIEIMTNPSAKYDAAGNSGIINIILKKNTQTGTNGSITVGGSLAAYPGDNTTLALNHKQGNLNVFATLSHNDNQQGRNINIARDVVDSGKSTFFNQHNYMYNADHNNTYRLGADYDISPKNTIGFVVSGYFNSELDKDNDNTYIGSAPTVVDSAQHSPSTISQTYKNIAVNLNDTYKIDTLGQQLTIDLDYSKFTNGSNAFYDTYFYLPNSSQQHPTQFLREQTPATIGIHTAKIDYTKPLTKTIKLETGAKFSDVKTDNNLKAQQLTNGAYTNDTTLANRFIYDEKIAAAYLNLTKTYKNTTVEAGLRAEYTSSRGDLVNIDSVAERKYVDLFPSFFIDHKFSDKNDLSFSYSRRIDRPNYADLNPFIYYLDQYTYQQGNPFLRPQYTNSFELDYTRNKTINVSLSYSHTADAITEIILTNVARKATYQTTLNLQSQNNYGIDVNSPYSIAKWWEGSFEVNTFYLAFKSDSLLGGNYNKGQVAYVIKATQTFLFAGFKAEVYTYYNSNLTYGIYNVKSRYAADVGINRSFDDKKLNIKFSVSDIFNTLTHDVSTNYQTDNFAITQKPQSRVARLTLTYNFGNTKISARKHQTGAEDENQRVKGSN